MTSLGKLLIVLGLLLVVGGGLLLIAGRFNLPVGRLPGDLTYRGKNFVVYFPLATSIVISIVLTIVIALLGKWRR